MRRTALKLNLRYGTRQGTTDFATVRAGAPAMMKAGGSIVLCATATARAGFAIHEVIAAAKGGVISLMAFLVHAAKSWIAGQVIDVSGGLSTTLSSTRPR